MVQSVSTRLGVVNSALTFIGERTVTSTSQSQASLLAVSSLPEVLSFISNRHFWPFLFAELITNPTSPGVQVTYSTDTVTINTPIIRVDRVWTTRSDLVVIPATYIEPNTYLRYYTPLAMSSDTDVVDKYTMLQTGSIKVRPYPNSNARKSLLHISVWTNLVMPSTDAGLFSMPEMYISMVTTLLASKLASRLLNNTQASMKYEADYEIQHSRFVETNEVRPRNYRPSVL